MAGRSPGGPLIEAFENGIPFASPIQKLSTGCSGDPNLKSMSRKIPFHLYYKPQELRRTLIFNPLGYVGAPPQSSSPSSYDRGIPSELQSPLRQGRHPAEQRATIPTAWPTSDQRLWDSISPAHSAHTAIRMTNGESRSPLRVNHPQFSLFTKTRLVTVPSAESIHSSATLRQHLQAKGASLVNTTIEPSPPSRRCGTSSMR
ncbi:hypothetical protein CRG98_042648 [Punica granatum]|uniref:Uncharacterized protein n=1 Tax=Punica granatum TaxID=22663 RepID=A0A2I0HZ27_PUNGR|nr:hypothetical protein CRG98_042648 [Punica granatum]